MQYVGLDVHKAFTYGVVMDKEGKVVFERKFKNEPHDMDMFLLNVQKDSKVALESCSCWQYVYDYVKDAGYTSVVLAHPLGVRVIATSCKKTDKNDATVIADLLRMNGLPEAYAAPWDVRAKRQITRHRGSLVGIQTEIKNKVHAILRRHGYNTDDQFSDVFGKSGIEYLHSLDLPSCDRLELDQYLEIFEEIRKRVNASQERIEELAGDDPAARILMSMPGISYYAALTIAAEIGDIRRFHSAEKLTSYAGLNPSVHQSGNRCKMGHISKRGNKNLRWILVQAANVAVMHDKLLARFYHRIRKTSCHNVALVATARKMLTYINTMLVHNIPYHALQIHKKAS